MNVQQMLSREEGTRYTAYLDTATPPVWTIGKGHTGPEVAPGLTWTDAQVELAFEADVLKASNAVLRALPWAGRLNEPRFAVLVGMAFQLGLKGLLGFSKTLAAVRDERFAVAAAEMLRSDWSKQTPARAKRMSAQMETGEWQ